MWKNLLLKAGCAAAFFVVTWLPASAETEHEAYIRKAIPKVAAKSDRYLKAAAKGEGFTDRSCVDGCLVQMLTGQIGLSLDVEEHSCAILSVLFGKGDVMAGDERKKDPGIKSRDYGDVAEYGASLANWVGAAERLLALPEGERVREWNIDCVGKYGIAKSHAVFRDDQGNKIEIQALFEFDNDTKVLRILGDIEAGFAEELEKELARNPKVETIALGSGGGALGEAFNAGRLIRQRKLDTTLYNDCESACTWVFLGGVRRELWRGSFGRLGFHQASRGGVAFPPDHEVYDLMREYVVEMGGKPDSIMKLVLNTPPDKMAYADYCETGMVTFVQGHGKCE